MTFETIHDATRLWIKGREFTVARLLGESFREQADKYNGGALAIFRLAPQDYHRCRSKLRHCRQVFEGPLELPGGSWVARCRDPQGAAFALQGKRSRDGIARAPASEVGWSTAWGGISSRGRLVVTTPRGGAPTSKAPASEDSGD